MSVELNFQETEALEVLIQVPGHLSRDLDEYYGIELETLHAMQRRGLAYSLGEASCEEWHATEIGIQAFVAWEQEQRASNCPHCDESH